MSIDSDTLTALTADITAAYVAHNAIAADAVPTLITSIHGALSGATIMAPAEPEYVPAVDPKKSVKPGYIVSLIDGQPYKMLRRHLSTHGLTPEEYRARYDLPSDYPMVAREYAEKRRQLAKDIGLGTNRNRGR